MVEATHHVRVDGDEVVKTYRCSYDDEHLREWKSLQLLHRHTPGLAPEPLRLETVCGAPTLRTSQVRGEPLAREPMTDRRSNRSAWR